jgi:hypothetical protein
MSERIERRVLLSKSKRKKIKLSGRYEHRKSMNLVGRFGMAFLPSLRRF